jgi:hypothetical protein
MAKKFKVQSDREKYKGVPKKFRPGHRLRGGNAPFPQLVNDETAKRWEKEGRRPINPIAIGDTE